MQDPIVARIENTPRPTVFAACGLVLLAAIGLWVSELAVNLLKIDIGGLALAECGVYYLPFLVLPVALYMRVRPGLSEGMRLGPMPPLGAIVVALLALISVFACSALAALWGWGLDALGLVSVGALPEPASRAELLMSVITMAAVPALCEELLFRGFVLSAWEGRGTYFAIGVSSALFALLHGNLYGLPASLLVGAVSGFICFALDSLYAGIAYHTIYNAACLVLPYVLSGGSDAAPAASTGLVLSVVLDALTSLSMMAMLLAGLRLRARRVGIEPIPRIRRPLGTGARLMLTAALLVTVATNLIVLVIALRFGNGGAL